jgi:AcrR family transcriptional regulator
VFQKKGYAAARTRDIAEEAGINLALLSYYFRSKEKLFEVIVYETLSGFFQNLIDVLNDGSITFEEKIELLATNYITIFSKEPDIPLFIFSEVHSRSENLLGKFFIRRMLITSVFVQQFQEQVAAGKIKEPNLLHFMMNFLGITVFPFIIGKPFISALGRLNERQFSQLMEERKKLIPAWIKAIMSAE